MPTDHNIRQLIINKLTDEEYEQAVKSADELYLTPDTSGGGSGTVTSVRVQATSPVVSSQSTEQTTTLNTTISLANNYGDTKNPYASKTKNYVLAAPVSANGTPSFRALDKADIPLASETAASGGTTTSLVTTGEKYTWNNKQDALPSQSGQSGKYLTTDGSSLSWATVSSGTVDYNDLTNKPSINSITLSGNQAGSDLGLVDEADLEEIDINNLVPSQSGNSGKYLTTNGSAVSWGTVNALPSQTGQSGKFLTTDGSTASWETVDALPDQTGQNGKFLTTNGTVASWADPTSKTIITLTSDQSSYTLTSNNIYSVSIGGSITTITFVLNIPSNTNISNDIIVHAYIGANSPTIVWGTQHFFNAEIPSIVNSGYYDITYVYNPLASYWVCKLNLVEAD